MSERLSKPLTTPITMSAEQLEEIRKMPRSGVRTALLEELDAQVAAHAETREQLAQAQKDTERLDWLSNNSVSISAHQHSNCSGDIYVKGKQYRASTLREAIDAAMEANTKALRSKPDQALPTLAHDPAFGEMDASFLDPPDALPPASATQTQRDGTQD